MSHLLRFQPLQRREELRQKGAEQAFTLAELMVGGAITVIVVSSLAAIALISELRLGRESEVNQGLRDNWDRAISFITNEAKQANWIRTSLPDGVSYACGGAAPTILLVLEGPPGPDGSGNPTPLWRTVYGVRSNEDEPTQWRGFNRLVRCGPPFLSDAQTDTSRSSGAGNLEWTGSRVSDPVESVVADQLAQTKPFVVQLTDDTAGRDRYAQINLFLSRRTGQTYPPATSFEGFQTQIRANRNPGFDVTGNSTCETFNSAGNEEPKSALCRIGTSNSRFSTNYTKEYNLTRTGSLKVQGSAHTNDVIFLKGNYDDFQKNTFQATATDTSPCSRASCYVSNGSQSVQIYDGNVLVFYDRIVRL